MASSIEINGKRILECSGGVFETLYYTFAEIIEEKLFDTDDSEFAKFISKMQLCSEARYPFFNVAKFIKSSKSLSILLEILEEAIKRLQKILIPATIDDLWKLYDELAKYKEELEAQGK